MSGRMYEALLGRKLSPDNYVGDPTNTQSYNRYSYVLNNPLKYIDPSGWRNVDVWQEDINAVNSDGHRGGGMGGYVGNISSLVGNSNSTYNYYGSYSMYANNSGYYSYLYGTQSTLQQYEAYGRQQSTLGFMKQLLNAEVTQKHRRGKDNKGDADNEIRTVSINYTFYFGNGVDMNNATAQLGTSFSSANYETRSHFIPLDAAIQGKLSKDISRTLGFTYESGLVNVMGHYFGYTSLVLMGYSVNSVIDIASKHEQFVGFGAKFFKDKNDLLDDAVDAKNNVLVFNKLIPYIQSLNKTYTSVLGLARDILSFMKTDGYYIPKDGNVVFEKLSEQQYNMYLEMLNKR